MPSLYALSFHSRFSESMYAKLLGSKLHRSTLAQRTHVSIFETTLASALVSVVNPR